MDSLASLDGATVDKQEQSTMVSGQTKEELIEAATKHCVCLSVCLSLLCLLPQNCNLFVGLDATTTSHGSAEGFRSYSRQVLQQMR